MMFNQSLESLLTKKKNLDTTNGESYKMHF